MGARTAFFLLLLSGCWSERSGKAPAVETVGTVVLAENEQIFVGEPTGFLVLKDGSFLISDKRNATLHHFGPDGSHLKNLGRRGDGPGEWSIGPYVLVSANDSVVYATEGLVVTGISYPALDFVSRQMVPPTTYLVAARDTVLYFIRPDAPSGRFLQSITTSGSAVSGGPVSKLLRGNKVVSQFFSFAAVDAARDGTVAAAVQHSDSLYFGSFAGDSFASVEVPVVRRRGALTALVRAARQSDPRTIARAAYRPSYPLGLARLSVPERYALVSADQEFKRNRMTGTLFGSVIDRRNGIACSDARIEAPTDPLPHVAFRGDTIFVLQQDENADGVNETVVRKLLLDPQPCGWEPHDDTDGLSE